MKRIVFAIIIISSLNSCKKYENDEGVQLKTAKSRIVNDWVIGYFYKNGKNKLDSFKLAQVNLVLSIYKNHRLIYAEDYFSRPGINHGTRMIFKGSWQFSKNKKSIILSLPFLSSGYELEILKLSESDLWLKTIDGSNEESHFIRKEK